MTSPLTVAWRTCAPITLVLLSVAGVSLAQLPLAPTSDTTIVVPVGVLHYSSIHIPAGVTVRFEAPGSGFSSVPGMPAVVRCDGDAIVHGTLSLNNAPFTPFNGLPAGWVTTGQGTQGYSCAGGGVPPGGGRHDYGSVLPFSLQGGSPGGFFASYSDQFCTQLQSFSYGGEGGGTLVLLAKGRIEIHGTVIADGRDGISGGSGGSILLRGDTGVSVLPSGSVTARGGSAPPTSPPNPPNMSSGEDGIIRLDAWGAAPVIQGTVYPTPTVLELPHLRAMNQPTIGLPFWLRVAAPAPGWVYVVASLAPASSQTAFGLLGVDLGNSAGIALATLQPSLDPTVNMLWPIPNSPSLVGLGLWLQAIAVPQLFPPRLTNTIAVVVQ